MLGHRKYLQLETCPFFGSTRSRLFLFSRYISVASIFPSTYFASALLDILGYEAGIVRDFYDHLVILTKGELQKFSTDACRYNYNTYRAFQLKSIWRWGFLFIFLQSSKQHKKRNFQIFFVKLIGWISMNLYSSKNWKQHCWTKFVNKIWTYFMRTYKIREKYINE